MSAKTVETLKARLAEAEAGIVGKIAARMGWVHMASVDELVTFVEEWTALHREALSEAATAERARLAGLASEGDREMVSNFGAVHIRCGIANAMQRPDTRELADKCDESAATLLARLAAVEGERERVMADYASELAMIFADRKANRMELLAKAAAVEEQVRLHEATIERQAEAIGILQRAESEAERRGAERALRLYWKTLPSHGDPDAWVAAWMATLFPPPGAEVGRG